MYRLSDELAHILLKKMRTPKIYTEGERRDLFTPADYRGIGIADPLCCIGSEFDYLLESPVPLIYPELPHIPPSIKGFFLYKRIELMQPMEPWLITRALVDPTAINYEEKIDCADCSIILSSDIDKLTCKTISTLEKLIEVEPMIIDSLNLDKK